MFAFLTRRARNEETGFTLIELLVVMIIIGILAAVAIPIFLNQQKTARDTATTSDVRNVASSVQTALVKHPDAKYFRVMDHTMASLPSSSYFPGMGVLPSYNTDINGDGKLMLIIGNSQTDFTPIEVSVSKGTTIGLAPVSSANTVATIRGGEFSVYGYNDSGKKYTSDTSALAYESGNGGLKR